MKPLKRNVEYSFVQDITDESLWKKIICTMYAPNET